MKNEGRALLTKIQALETYPPRNDVSLVGKSEDYQHIKEYNMKGSSIGTLSQSEWEVTC